MKRKIRLYTEKGITEEEVTYIPVRYHCNCIAVRSGLRPVDVLSMTYSQHALIGSGGYMPEDVADVMNIMESGRWDIESIITHEFPWEQLPQAIETASRTDEALNVVIKY